jgi:mono/diheme cytochrome c family protein
MFVMSSCSKRKDAETRRRGDTGKFTSPRPRFPVSPRLLILLLTAHCSLLTVACRRDMQDQPKAIAYRESTFYKDGISSRPLVEGTVPRGYLRADRELYLGKKSTSGAQPGPVLTQPAGAQATAPTIRLPTTPVSSTNLAAMFPDDVETIPFPIDKDALDRGQERYQIFCSVCHGMTGYGDGIVARRGFNKPPPASYHQDRLRQAPVGHFFDVMTNGWGAMPSYASQIPVADRWKIIAYIRALQLSQMPTGISLSVSERGSNPALTRGANEQPRGPRK